MTDSIPGNGTRAFKSGFGYDFDNFAGEVFLAGRLNVGRSDAVTSASFMGNAYIALGKMSRPDGWKIQSASTQWKFMKRMN